MKKFLVIAVLAGLSAPFARMIFDLASTSKSYEVGISTSQINPTPAPSYFSIK